MDKVWKITKNIDYILGVLWLKMHDFSCYFKKDALKVISNLSYNTMQSASFNPVK